MPTKSSTLTVKCGSIDQPITPLKNQSLPRNPLSAGFFFQTNNASAFFHIFFPTSHHPYIPTSHHPYIPTSLHPNLLTSQHPIILTSLHPNIPTSHHPYILTSQHPHIKTSQPPNLPLSFSPFQDSRAAFAPCFCSPKTSDCCNVWQGPA